MTDLISRRAAIKAIDDLPNCYNGYSDTYDKAYIIGVLEELPTIDAVEVVRCKDCKHSEHWYRDKRRCFFWHDVGIGVFEDGFCNYGERSEE